MRHRNRLRFLAFFTFDIIHYFDLKCKYFGGIIHFRGWQFSHTLFERLTSGNPASVGAELKVAAANRPKSLGCLVLCFCPRCEGENKSHIREVIETGCYVRKEHI